MVTKPEIQSLFQKRASIAKMRIGTANVREESCAASTGHKRNSSGSHKLVYWYLEPTKIVFGFCAIIETWSKFRDFGVTDSRKFKINFKKFLKQVIRLDGRCAIGAAEIHCVENASAIRKPLQAIPRTHKICDIKNFWTKFCPNLTILVSLESWRRDLSKFGKTKL